jgi:hypothetical protein
MSLALNDLRYFRNKKALNLEDFAPICVASTRDGRGSVYLYKPLKSDEDSFRGFERRHAISSFSMVFAGCVIEMVEDVGGM